MPIPYSLYQHRDSHIVMAISIFLFCGTRLLMPSIKNTESWHPSCDTSGVTFMPCKPHRDTHILMPASWKSNPNPNIVMPITWYHTRDIYTVKASDKYPHRATMPSHSSPDPTLWSSVPEHQFLTPGWWCTLRKTHILHPISRYPSRHHHSINPTLRLPSPYSSSTLLLDDSQTVTVHSKTPRLDPHSSPPQPDIQLLIPHAHSLLPHPMIPYSLIPDCDWTLFLL